MSDHPTPARVVARVHARTTPGAGGCVLSTYSTGSHGYAQVGYYVDGVRVARLVHRIAWEEAHGIIPDGMTVDHLCHVRTCVELEHLRLIPNLENARRTSGRNWNLGKCARGHDDAVYWRPKGPTRRKGYCHACRMEIQRARRRRARAAGVDVDEGTFPLD